MSADNDARPASFPQDIASCHAMLEGVFQSLVEKEKRIGELEDFVQALLDERSARKSERYDPDQLALFQLEAQGDAPNRRKWMPIHQRSVDATEAVAALTRMLVAKKSCTVCGMIRRCVPNVAPC